MLNVMPDDRHDRARLEGGLDAGAGESRLFRLGERDASGGRFVDAAGPDVRGWAVSASDGRRIGVVHDLLADTGAGRVRWLDVEVDRATVRSGEARCVLVPVGLARIDEARREVRLPALSGATVARLPGCEHGPVSRWREREILARLLRSTSTDDAPAPGLPGDDADFYDQPCFRGA